jgi:transcriptional regulator with XRE-family HTH domain
MNEEFQLRLKKMFDYGTMADIARILEVPHATVRNYFRGRLPAPEVLIKIANATNISLNWLLIGQGEMYAAKRRSLDLNRLLEDKIDEILEKKLGPRSTPIQDLGTVDSPPPFDVEEAVRKTADPQKVMNDWFKYEGRRYPKDYAVIFFQGWESYSDEERIDALRDAKKVLDRTLRKTEFTSKKGRS